MRVTNGIPFGRSLLLPVDSVNSVQTLKVSEWLSPAGVDQFGDPMFTVNGTNGCVLFRSYYSLQTEVFSVYPDFVPNAGPGQRGQCGVTKENWPSETTQVCLACPTGKSVSDISSAEFGLLDGNCSSGIKPGRCVANSTLVKRVVEQHCLGTHSCSIPVNFKLFGPDPCPDAYKSLGVTVACSVGTCDMAVENWPEESTEANLGCDAGQTISAVVGAEFGILAGNCSSGFKASGCTANATVVKEVVQARCMGKQSCVVPADTKLYGINLCPGQVKTLAVQVGCTHTET
jgi:hypothetical protein